MSASSSRCRALSCSDSSSNTDVVAPRIASQRGQFGGLVPEPPHEQRVQVVGQHHVRLRREVPVERALRDHRGRCDLLHRGVLVTLLAEQAQGVGLDVLAHLGSFPFPQCVSRRLRGQCRAPSAAAIRRPTCEVGTPTLARHPPARRPEDTSNARSRPCANAESTPASSVGECSRRATATPANTLPFDRVRGARQPALVRRQQHAAHHGRAERPAHLVHGLQYRRPDAAARRRQHRHAADVAVAADSPMPSPTSAIQQATNPVPDDGESRRPRPDPRSARRNRSRPSASPRTPSRPSSPRANPPAARRSTAAAAAPTPSRRYPTHPGSTAASGKAHPAWPGPPTRRAPRPT